MQRKRRYHRTTTGLFSSQNIRVPSQGTSECPVSHQVPRSANSDVSTQSKLLSTVELDSVIPLQKGPRTTFLTLDCSPPKGPQTGFSCLKTLVPIPKVPKSAFLPQNRVSGIPQGVATLGLCCAQRGVPNKAKSPMLHLSLAMVICGVRWDGILWGQTMAQSDEGGTISEFFLSIFGDSDCKMGGKQILSKEWAEVGKPRRSQTLPNPLSITRAPSLRATSPRLLDACRDGDSPAPWAAVPLPHCFLGAQIVPVTQPGHRTWLPAGHTVTITHLVTTE